VSNTNTCNATNGLKEFDCNITFSDDVSSYQELCATRDSVVYNDTVLVDCKILFGTTQLKMHLQDIPICVPSECDLSTLSHDDINVTTLTKNSLRSESCKVDGTASTSEASVLGISAGATLLVLLGSLAFM
jgi:hypothetical protein